MTTRQTFVLFVLMGFGILATRLGMLTEDTIRRLSSLLVSIITPCLIISSFQRPYESSLVAGLGWAFAASLLATGFAIALAHLFVRNRDLRRMRALRWAAAFSNCGYMGLPLEEALLGPKGVFYGVAAIAVFNLLAWTYGVWLMGGAEGRRGFIRGLVNPALISVLVALPLFFVPWRLPDFIATPISMMGSMNTTLAMLIMGHCLSQTRFEPAFRCPGTYVMGCIRHFLAPIALTLVLTCCPFISVDVRLAAIIPAAAPIGVLLTIFSVRYDGDIPFASALVAASTLFAIFSVPLVVGLARVLMPV